MSQVLYRKYRPKTFDEVQGQEHVVRTLEGALLSGRVGHAYLFAGPRGTGKTTMARLLAKTINCEKYEATNSNSKQIEPCNKCDSCNAINDGRSLDLIEIDAASNRGIDEIRNLKDSAQVAATSGGNKVFIIDEVHMLTPPAFNALLKILEEPPSHTMFIMATTEAHKVPDTVLSRVQRFDFKKINQDQIISKLKRIAQKEKITIEDQALAALASAASGSLRDAESSFNKIIAHHASHAGRKAITLENVEEALGIVPRQVHEKLIASIVQRKPNEAIAHINELYESGLDIEHFVKHFVRHLRVLLVESVNSPQESIQPVPTDFLVKAVSAFARAGAEMRHSPIPQLPLELAIIELSKHGNK